jgi:glycosyltransferase 2 family protein
MSRRAALAWGTTLFSLLLIYLVLRKVDFGEFWRALASSNYWWLLPSLAGLTLTVFLRGLRWRYLFAPETRPPVRAVLSALLIGYLFNNVLPARAGEAARLVVLNQRTGTSRVEALGTAITERVYDVLVLLLLLFAALPFLPDVEWLGAAALFALLVVVLLAVTVAVLVRYRERPLRFAFKPLSRVPRFTVQRTEKWAANLVHGLAAFLRPELMLAPLALTALSWLTLALSYWILMLGFDLGLGFGAALLAVIAVNLAMLIPAPPASLGVFEAAVLAALAAYGIGASEALSYAVVLHALNFLPFIVVGYAALHRHTMAVRRAGPTRSSPPGRRAGQDDGGRERLPA